MSAGDVFAVLYAWGRRWSGGEVEGNLSCKRSGGRWVATLDFGGLLWLCGYGESPGEAFSDLTDRLQHEALRREANRAEMAKVAS